MGVSDVVLAHTQPASSKKRSRPEGRTETRNRPAVDDDNDSDEAVRVGTYDQMGGQEEGGGGSKR